MHKNMLAWLVLLFLLFVIVMWWQQQKQQREAASWMMMPVTWTPFYANPSDNTYYDKGDFTHFRVGDSNPTSTSDIASPSASSTTGTSGYAVGSTVSSQYVWSQNAIWQINSGGITNGSAALRFYPAQSQPFENPGLRLMVGQEQKWSFLAPGAYQAYIVGPSPKIGEYAYTFNLRIKNVTKPTATKMITSFVQQQPYFGLFLTPRGYLLPVQSLFANQQQWTIIGNQSVISF